MRDVTYVTLMTSMYRSGLEEYRQHIAATTSGMELMGGGSKRLHVQCEERRDGLLDLDL